MGMTKADVGMKIVLISFARLDFFNAQRQMFQQAVGDFPMAFVSGGDAADGLEGDFRLDEALP